jgi:hypothetical protein
MKRIIPKVLVSGLLILSLVLLLVPFGTTQDLKPTPNLPPNLPSNLPQKAVSPKAAADDPVRPSLPLYSSATFQDNQVTLREYLQDQIRWMDRYFADKLADAQIAITRAENQLNKRLEGMNEFRDTLKDQAAKLATKDEMLGQIGSLERRIQTLERNVGSREDAVAQNVAIEKRFQTIEKNEATSAGKTSVTTVLWALAGSVLAAFVTSLLIRSFTARK